MSDKALRVVDVRLTTIRENLAQRLNLEGVARVSRRCVSIDDVDILGTKSRVLQRLADALRLALRIGKNEVGGVGIHTVAEYFAINLRAALLRVAETFEDVNAPPFRDDDTVAIRVERTRRLRRILVMRERSLRVKRRKNTERMNTLGNAPRKRQVDFSQSELLHSLNQRRVSSRARSAQRIMRPRDPITQRYFPCGIIRDRSRIMVMRPVRAVVIILFDFVDLIFGLDVPVFRHADIDARGALIDAIPVQTRVRDRLADAIHGKASRARSATNFS